MRYFVIIMFIVVSFRASAQDTIPDNPKVGLVLSGGGAKGLAHIGVLKVLEETGVRVDYIGGTSMGAIIGALYASGYSAHQLDSIFTSTDLQALIQDNLPRRSKTFYEKDDAEKYAITLPFDGLKISFPSALSRGQNIYNLLAKLTSSVSGIEDFSKLPIPFFCVATDVVTGEAVFLNKGYLPEAITASGALPSLFSPVDIDGRLLVDGGVVNNYPVDQVRAKGMDIIIGVDVQDDLRDRDALRSAPEILLQINNYRTIADMGKKIKKTDIYIKPDIEEFTVISFDLGEDIIAGGKKKARDYEGRLKAIAQKQHPSFAKTDFNPLPKDSLDFETISVKGNKEYTRAYILGKLKIKTPRKVSWDKFIQGINNLAATDNFQRINYKLMPVEGGQLLSLRVRESPNNTFIRLGVHYDDLYKSAALGNLTKKSFLQKNDVFSLDLALGDNIRYLVNYHKDQGYYISYGIRSRYDSFDQRVDANLAQRFTQANLAGLNRITLDYQDFTNQFYIQTLFDKEFLLEMGAEHKFLEVETENLEAVIDGRNSFAFESSNFYSAYGKLLLDTRDERYFPTKGWYFKGNFNLYLFSSDFNDNFSEFSIAKAELSYARELFSRFSGVIGASGGFKIGGAEINSLDFFLGGYGNNFVNNLIPFYGYDFVSLTGDGYVKANLTFDYELLPKNHINIGANFANVETGLFETGNWLSTPDFSGYFVGYGLETFLGPMQAKYSFSPETGDGRFFVSLGFWF